MSDTAAPDRQTAPSSVQGVLGIDVHVHIATGDGLRALQAEAAGGPASGGATTATDSARATAARAYFGNVRTRVTADEVAEQYRKLNLLAVVFDLDSELQTGRKISN